MAFFATSGTKIYVGGVKEMQSADFSSADFSSETWTEIQGTEKIGTIGDTSDAVLIEVQNEARSKTIKGGRNAGTMELVSFLDYADAGQLALIAAEKTDNNYAFKIEFSDAPAGGTPSERYFIGVVMSATEQLENSNSAARLNTSVAINSNIARVAAAAP